MTMDHDDNHPSPMTLAIYWASTIFEAPIIHKINDEIYLTDLDYVYHYKVSLKREVSPSEVQWLDEIPNKELVTLVTCGDLSAETRIIIQVELQERIPINEIPEDIRNAFELEQLTY